MIIRKTKDKSKHDLGIKHEAEELEKDGWNVLADHISEYKKKRPPNIANHRPDIYATKSGHTRIVEIETDEDDDHDQHTAFRRHAGQMKNTIFYGWIVDSIGRRVEKFD